MRPRLDSLPFVKLALLFVMIGSARAVCASCRSPAEAAVTALVRYVWRENSEGANATELHVIFRDFVLHTFELMAPDRDRDRGPSVAPLPPVASAERDVHGCEPR